MTMIMKRSEKDQDTDYHGNRRHPQHQDGDACNMVAGKTTVTTRTTPSVNHSNQHKMPNTQMLQYCYTEELVIKNIEAVKAATATAELNEQQPETPSRKWLTQDNQQSHSPSLARKCRSNVSRSE